MKSVSDSVSPGTFSSCFQTRVSQSSVGAVCAVSRSAENQTDFRLAAGAPSRPSRSDLLDARREARRAPAGGE